MSVSKIASIALKSVGPAPRVSVGKGFGELKQELQKSANLDLLFAPDIQKDLARIERGIVQGKVFSPQELIGLQIKAHHFGIRVELVARLAESGVATLKRLQNPQ